MSTAADLILASRDDAQAILASDYPLGSFKGVNVDGLDPLLLAALQALLTPTPFEEVLQQYQPIGQASPEGPWLVRVPAELIESLNHVAPPDYSPLAARWASTDQAKDVGWSQIDADGFLGRLVPFAHTAAFERRGLFLCLYD